MRVLCLCVAWRRTREELCRLTPHNSQNQKPTHPNPTETTLKPTGFFPDLPWTPANLRLLPVALALHHSLLRHPEGRAFLLNEPRARGALQEFAALLQHTLQHLGVSSSSGNSGNSPVAAGVGAGGAARPASPTMGGGGGRAAGGGSFSSHFSSLSPMTATQRLLGGGSPGGGLGLGSLFGSPTASGSQSLPAQQAADLAGSGTGPSCCLDARCVVGPLTPPFPFPRPPDQPNTLNTPTKTSTK